MAPLSLKDDEQGTAPPAAPQRWPRRLSNIAALLVFTGLAILAANEFSDAFHVNTPPLRSPNPLAGRGRAGALDVNSGRRQGGFGGGGVRPETKVVDQFDVDKNGRLNTAERRNAREWLGTGSAGYGGRGRGPSRPAPQPGPRLTPADVRTYPLASKSLYDLGTLRTLFLEFEEPDWEKELATFYNSDVDVPAMVTVDGATYRDVGVHFRGNSSYRGVPEGYKRSMNLSFDFANKDQRLGGYSGTNLLNANQDATFMRLVLYGQIARDYIPAPKANFVRVAINGESWGVYVNTQQFNKDFLNESFGTTGGHRWKVPGSPGARSGLNYLGEDVESYKRLYEIKSKDDPKAWADFIKLCRVLDQTPVDQLESALAPLLDIDGALKFLALDIALVNSDGYWTRASDFDVYEDPKGRFHILPHDMNEGLGAEEGRGASPQLDPLFGLDDTSKPLRSRLLNVPALRTRYLTYVRDIANRWLDWKTIGPLVAQYQSLIEADVRADTRKLYGTDAFRDGVGEAGGWTTSLRGFMDARRAYLLHYTPPGRGRGSSPIQ